MTDPETDPRAVWPDVKLVMDGGAGDVVPTTVVVDGR